VCYGVASATQHKHTVEHTAKASRVKAHLQENCIVRTTNTFVSILFLREESSQQQYLDSYLQDNSGDMQYSASNPVRTEFYFSALCHGYYVLWAKLLFVVVCWCTK
jgi:hypothetical protein